ncbi:hypothetical protein TRFO_10298 [Tritrichomonas foetus]|uniref:Transmembrane protein n=1 Tax=Tritrichomonas foetus TaxID=1144522 RepID=A0A1J4JCA8_9EUKA|nr:hypothetical protein TRFO_10298 [Tritrichomonas foetus]|eukprot:OHS95887.1 hypothetical protein TRFO_10298 [Tritrichomonas foetus]
MLLTTFVFLGASYISFPERVQTQTFSGKSGEQLEIFTPSIHFVAAVTYFDPQKTSIFVASPSQSPLENIGSDRAFYFPYGNSKIVLNFIKDSEVVINFAAIPSTACRSGIEVIINESHKLDIVASENLVDRCYFFAYPSDKHRFKVVENRLKQGTKLCTFHDYVNDNPYSCYTVGSSTSTAYEPGGGSSAPWIFRLTTGSETDISPTNSIHVDLLATIKKEEYRPVEPFIGQPKRFNQPVVDKYYKKWWIPVVGAISPLFLLISWVVTFVKLLSKRPINKEDEIAP